MRTIFNTHAHPDQPLPYTNKLCLYSCRLLHFHLGQLYFFFGRASMYAAIFGSAITVSISDISRGYSSTMVVGVPWTAPSLKLFSMLTTARSPMESCIKHKKQSSSESVKRRGRGAEQSEGQEVNLVVVGGTHKYTIPIRFECRKRTPSKLQCSVGKRVFGNDKTGQLIKSIVQEKESKDRLNAFMGPRLVVEDRQGRVHSSTTGWTSR